MTAEDHRKRGSSGSLLKKATPETNLEWRRDNGKPAVPSNECYGERL